MGERVNEAYVGPNSLNVGIITPFFTPIAGGSASSAFILARSLQTRGYGVTVFTSDYRRKESRFEDESGMTIVESRCLANLSGFLYAPELKRELKKDAQTIEIFDLANFRTYQNIVATRFARQHGVPYVLRAHGSIPRLGKSIPKRLFDRLYGNKILDNSSKLVALTKVEAEQYQEFGVESNRISVIPNGIELGRFSNLPTRGEFASKFKVDPGTRIILFLGRIHRIKGIDTLIKSYCRLAKDKSNGDNLLVIAGPDDGYLQDAQLMARRLGIGDNVLFCGLLNFRDKLAAIVDSAVVVLPSYYETFPNVVLESYACSRPVIASRVQGMEEIVIDGQTGILFSAGNVEQLTESISSVVKDVERANAMGRRARELVEREYDQSKLIPRTEAIYEETTGTSKPTAPKVH